MKKACLFGLDFKYEFLCFFCRLLTTENVDENILASLENNQENIEPNENKHVIEVFLTRYKQSKEERFGSWAL